VSENLVFVSWTYRAGARNALETFAGLWNLRGRTT
jgi:hypothetical protein